MSAATYVENSIIAELQGASNYPAVMDKATQLPNRAGIESADTDCYKPDLPKSADHPFRSQPTPVQWLITVCLITIVLGGCTGFRHAWYMRSAVFQPLTTYSRIIAPQGINPRYVKLANQAGRHYDVPPALILAICDQESRFNARAVSSTGAEGLMQLMPDTAAQMGVSRPFAANQAIWGGTRYLALLLHHYGGNLNLALAAYHSGAKTIAEADDRVPPQSQSYVSGVIKKYHYFSRFRNSSKSTPPP